MKIIECVSLSIFTNVVIKYMAKRDANSRFVSKNCAVHSSFNVDLVLIELYVVPR
jgi:hypothetical protein